MWDSVLTADPCKMSGAYGWFKTVGVNSVFIRETVHGCELMDGNVVLTWAQIENPDKAGDYEGFYCTVPYTAGDASASVLDVNVVTLDGELDFANWDAVVPEEWCKDMADTETMVCKRQSID